MEEPLREQIFNSPAERKALAWYRRIFSIEEIEKSLALKWVFGATIFSHFVAFSSWFYSRSTTVDAIAESRSSCWPHFQGCEDLLFLRTLPDGYSQPFLYMVLFGTLILSVYLMHKKEWVLAHMALVPSFLWHTFATFVLTYSLSGNYEYYLAILAFVLLFIPHKEFFLKLSLVLFYFLAGTIKIHEGWVLGTYFSALHTGIPLFPDWSIPIWTNVVIFMEIVGAWFLFSKNALLQRLAVSFFVIFHLYSGLLVGYRYPSTVLPSVMILFALFYAPIRVPFNKKAIVGWLMVAVLFAGQAVAMFIPGDVKLTLEGNNYGLYMFEANHQCVSSISLVDGEGVEVASNNDESSSARNRCDPYRYWFSLQRQCPGYEQAGVSVKWTFDHSINGGPLLRIIDTDDACALKYKAFQHNDWIKTEENNPEVIGYPLENFYR